MDETTTTVCVELVDVYGYSFGCVAATPGNPCVDVGSRLYTLEDCDVHDGSRDAWCAAWPDHPVCAWPTPTTTTEVGGPAPVLPTTGAGDTAMLGGFLGLTLVLAGVALVRVTRRGAR